MLAALGAALPAAHAQRASGSLGVAATILPAIPAHAARLITLDVERDGILRLAMAPPRVGSVTQIVMTTISSSANGFVPLKQEPMLVETMPRRGSRELEPRQADGGDPVMRFELDVGRRGAVPPAFDTRDVTVRISYLVVPGT